MRILIVDDESESRRWIREAIEKGNFSTPEIVEAVSGEDATAKIVSTEPFDVVLTDLIMEGLDGLKVLKAAKDAYRDTEVILVTAYATIESAVKAIKAGAYDYICKPVHAEEVQQVLRRIFEVRRLTEELERFRTAVESRDTVENIVGTAEPILRLKQTILTVAETDAHVLITGETGTGKELVARALHALSNRKTKPMVAINCAALPENLLESELFGYRKGAFTGALTDKRGLIDEADASTLFLDEIGDLSLPLQAKLLRVLDTGEFRRLGDVRPKRVSLRVVAATHVDLDSAIRESKFREDLYYRLNVFQIALPPLRERPEDIPLLVHHFVRLFADKFKRAVDSVAPDALIFLSRIEWTGNVRELQHVIERAVLLSNGNVISLKEMTKLAEKDVQDGDRVRPLAEMEKTEILRALRKFGGQKDRTARELGISPATLWRKLKEYGIQATTKGG